MLTILVISHFFAIKNSSIIKTFMYIDFFELFSWDKFPEVAPILFYFEVKWTVLLLPIFVTSIICSLGLARIEICWQKQLRNNGNFRNQHLVFVRAEAEGQRTKIQREFFSGGLVNLSKKLKRKRKKEKDISFILSCQGSQEEKAQKEIWKPLQGPSIGKWINKM